MGIYRAWLEEEVPHLDKTNDPDDQIKELEGIIADSDANEEEQEEAQEASFGPDGGVDDIMDESWIAIAEFEAGNNDIMKAIGYHELNEAAEGREFLFEGVADIKGFFKSAKDKIIAFFKKVWSVIQRWAGNITAMVSSNKKLVEKYSGEISKGYSIIQNQKGVKKMKGFTFSGLDGSGTLKDSLKVTKAEIDEMKEIKEQISKAASSANEMSWDSESMSAEGAEAILADCRKDLAGKECSASNFASTLKEKFYGENEPKELWMTSDDVIAILSGRKDDLKAIKEFMKDSKNEFKSILSSLKELESSVSKIENATNRNKAMSVCIRANTTVKSMMSMTQVWRSQLVHAINARGRQARRYAMAYIQAVNRNNHKGFRKESTEYGFLGNIGLV